MEYIGKLIAYSAPLIGSLGGFIKYRYVQCGSDGELWEIPSTVMFGLGLGISLILFFGSLYIKKKKFAVSFLWWGLVGILVGMFITSVMISAKCMNMTEKQEVEQYIHYIISIGGLFVLLFLAIYKKRMKKKATIIEYETNV